MCVADVFKAEKEGCKALRLKKVITSANKKLPNHEKKFVGGEIAAAIEKMTNDNDVMLTDGVLFLI